jgi:hypothetical protein
MMIDTNNSVWQEVKAHAEAEIVTAQQRLEQPALSATETEFERGRIKALRGLLDLVKPKIVIPSTDPLYS